VDQDQKRGELTLGLLAGSATVGASPASDGGLRADQSITDVPNPNVGASPASDGGLKADQSLSDVLNPMWEPALLAMAACEPTSL
jgi:hypothetical protein